MTIWKKYNITHEFQSPEITCSFDKTFDKKFTFESDISIQKSYIKLSNFPYKSLEEPSMFLGASYGVYEAKAAAPYSFYGAKATASYSVCEAKAAAPYSFYEAKATASYGVCDKKAGAILLVPPIRSIGTVRFHITPLREPKDIKRIISEYKFHYNVNKALEDLNNNYENTETIIEKLFEELSDIKLENKDLIISLLKAIKEKIFREEIGGIIKDKIKPNIENTGDIISNFYIHGNFMITIIDLIDKYKDIQRMVTTLIDENIMKESNNTIIAFRILNFLKEKNENMKELIDNKLDKVVLYHLDISEIEQNFINLINEYNEGTLTITNFKIKLGELKKSISNFKDENLKTFYFPIIEMLLSIDTQNDILKKLEAYLKKVSKNNQS